MRTPVLALAALAELALAGRSAALVHATDPDDGSAFLGLYRPTGQFDEAGLSGFEFLISSRMGEFRANDQYLIAGQATEETTALGSDLGAVGDLSGRSFDFSIEHHLAGGRNFTFRLTDPLPSATSVLCWGEDCPPGSNATELLAGIPPIADYNGLQIQVRAQDVAGSSAAVTITSLAGVELAGADLFDEVVTPDAPGTVFTSDLGRRGQWLLGDSLDLVQNEWQLTGTVTLRRPDAALEDVTKVRLAVDLVRDPELPFVPAPEPGAPLLSTTGLAALLLRSARERWGPSPGGRPAGRSAETRGRRRWLAEAGSQLRERLTLEFYASLYVTLDTKREAEDRPSSRPTA